MRLGEIGASHFLSYCTSASLRPIALIAACTVPLLTLPLHALTPHPDDLHYADEIDAIGTKRYDAHSGGEREIQRTMLELLNQLDGFDAMSEVKVSHAVVLWPTAGFP